jgi:C-terminal processing protease CtpA/Prc
LRKTDFALIFFSGDEIFSVNGRSVAGLTHQEAIAIFKEVKQGAVQVAIGRREPRNTILSVCE